MLKLDVTIGFVCLFSMIRDAYRALWVSRTQGLSVSPSSLIIGNSLHSASMTFPEFHWADSSRC